MRVTIGDRSFRLSSTDPLNDQLLQRLEAAGAKTAPDLETALETVFARITVGQRPRLQQLLDGLGNVVFAGRSVELARAAVENTVAALLLEATDPEALFVECPAIWTTNGVAFVHVMMREQVMGPLRRALAGQDVTFVPGHLLEIDRNAPHLSVRVVSLDGSTGQSFPVTGVVAAGNGDSDRALSALTYLLRTWNQGHLDWLPHLARVPFIEMPYECSHNAVVDELAALAQT